MEIFNKTEESDWNSTVRKLDCGSMMMQSDWGGAISKNLPFVTYQYFRYRDSHIIRLAGIDGRLTTVPFSEGGDVVPIVETEIDSVKFQADLCAYFGDSVRLRINERFTPVSHEEGIEIVANDHVVELEESILPKVRKTLRHILSHTIEGNIKRSTDVSDIEEAYRLYIRHMRNVRNFSLPKSLFVSLICDYGGDLWTWSKNSGPEAMAIFIPFNSEVQYSLSAANSTALSVHAPHHILYTALEHYRSKGIKQASLGATGKGSSLEVFKRGWRGKQYAIYEIGPRSRNITKTSHVRNLVRFVPLVFYPLLTTRIGKYFL